jgi:AcrR family transcriptional regulator
VTSGPAIERDEAERAVPPEPESLTARQKARRDRIIAAAIDDMIRYDFDDIQMKDVATSAGVALGTMYRYFTSKEHLFAEALASWAERFRSEVTGASGKTSTGRLKLAFRRAVRAFELHPPVYGHLLVLEASRDRYARKVYERFAQRQSEAFAGFLPGVESPMREDIINVMGAVLDASLRDWSRGRRSIADVYTAVDRAADLLLRAA